MKDRIKELRKALGITQQEFANKLGVKQNTIACYEIGKINISDAVIHSISREFNVNEEWIRTGKLPMFKEKKFSEFLSEISIGDDDFIRAILETYIELDDVSKKALKEIIYSLSEKLNKRD